VASWSGRTTIVNSEFGTARWWSQLCLDPSAAQHHVISVGLNVGFDLVIHRNRELNFWSGLQLGLGLEQVILVCLLLDPWSRVRLQACWRTSSYTAVRNRVTAGDADVDSASHRWRQMRAAASWQGGSTSAATNFDLEVHWALERNCAESLYLAHQLSMFDHR
jgi:hypothetical protein